MSKVKLIPLNLGDRIQVRDRTMISPREAEVIAVYRRRVRIKLSDGEIVIDRKYIRQKI